MGRGYEYLWDELTDAIRTMLEKYNFSTYALNADQKTKGRLAYGDAVPTTGIFRGRVEIKDDEEDFGRYSEEVFAMFNILYEVKWLGVGPDDFSYDHTYSCELKSIWEDGEEEPQSFFKLDKKWGEDYYLGGYRQYEALPLYKIRITDELDGNKQTIVVSRKWVSDGIELNYSATKKIKLVGLFNKYERFDDCPLRDEIKALVETLARLS